MPADEFETPQGQEGREPEQDRRAGYLPWLVLLVVLLIVAWLVWRYAQRPGVADVDGRGVSVATTAVVPDVTGMTKRAAQAKLSSAGFAVESDLSYDAVAEPGTVAGQDPAGGTRRAKGDIVVIQVAVDLNAGQGGAGVDDAFTNEVPSVIGLTEEDAADALKRGGYRISVLEVYSEDKPMGVVYQQTPGAGESAEPGTVVDAIISLGPTPQSSVTMPNVVGMGVDAAAAKLKSLGLDPQARFQPRSGSGGIVYQQDPSAGTTVDVGAKVFILAGAKAGY